MDGNDLGDGISFRYVREAIQLQQDHATHAQLLANDEFAEIADPP
jgi:hypothetical protein